MLAAITPFFLFVAFLLLLLVSLSLPIIKSIFLFRLTANDTASFLHASASASGEVRFGVWGYCTLDHGRLRGVRQWRASGQYDIPMGWSTRTALRVREMVSEKPLTWRAFATLESN